MYTLLPEVNKYRSENNTQMPQYLGGLIPVNEKHLSHCYKASLIIHFVLFSSEFWVYSFRADLN